MHFIDPEYLDGTSGYPRGFDPNSNINSAHSVARQAFESLSEDKGNEHKLHSTSILFMVFGQFIDHDITVTSHAKTSSCSSG
jgi:Animal haem peroxidase.